MPRGIYDRTKFKKKQPEAVITEHADVDLMGVIEPARPIAELCESYHPEKPYETFMKSLCIHGLYKPLCKRCEQ